MAEGRSRSDSALMAAAGVLGASGVALGAASAHLGGGDLARLAALFLLIHAAAVPGIVAVPLCAARVRRIAAALLCGGAVLFSGALGVLAFAGRLPVDGLAPVGGFMLMAGWLTLAVAPFTGCGGPSSRA